MRFKSAIKTALFLIIIFISTSGSAHPLSEERFGQRVLLEMFPDHIEYSYVVEIPASLLLKKISEFQIERATKELDENVSDKFNRYMLKQLKEGIKLYIDGKRYGWQQEPNFKESSGRGEPNFFEYRLKLYAHLPDISSKKVQFLEIVNGNFEDKKTAYLNGLVAESGVQIEETNIPKKMDWNEDYSFRRLKIKFKLNSNWQRKILLGSASQAEEEGELKDKISKLLYSKRLTPTFLLIALGTAFVLGAVHAFSPGHGKALVSAYLVGAKGRYIHAILLGIIVTITHTGTVFILGLLFLLFPGKLMPERAMPYIGVASGVIITLIGFFILYKRWMETRREGHEHNHEISPPNLKSLLAMGVSGGMIPCPSAMALMLIAISVGQAGWGMILIGVYSLGLAAVLIVLGCLAVGAIDIFQRMKAKSRIWSFIPVASSIVILLLGISIVIAALRTL